MTVNVETVHSPAPKTGKPVSTDQTESASDQPLDDCDFEDCYYPIEQFYDDE